MFDLREDARDRDGREDGRARVYDERDRDDDPREGLMRDLDLPRDEERALVAVRDRVYELDGEDSRTLAAVGAFRVVPEHDLDTDHDTLEHLHDEGLVETVDLGDDERGLAARTTRTSSCSLSTIAALMRVVKDRVLYVWEQECADAKERTAEQERRLKAVRQRLDRLDEAFLYSESIDLATYTRQRDKLREELTFSKID
jgi:hypothetical protein